MFREISHPTAVCKRSGTLWEEGSGAGGSVGLVTWTFLRLNCVDFPGRGKYNAEEVELKRAVSLKTLLRAVFNSVCNNGTWGGGWGKGQVPTEGGLAPGAPLRAVPRNSLELARTHG